MAIDGGAIPRRHAGGSDHFRERKQSASMVIARRKISKQTEPRSLEADMRSAIQAEITGVEVGIHAPRISGAWSAMPVPRNARF